MLKPVQLRTLTVVVRTGSFTLAGRELGYTASAVAQHVAALERTLGIRLVDREPQRIRPTPAAYLLATRSQHALEVLDALEEEANALAQGKLGRLAIGTALDVGTPLVTEALARLSSSRARLDVRLEDLSPKSILERVLTGSLDVGLVYDYPSAPRRLSAELGVATLVEEAWQLVLPLRWRGARQLRGLADQEWIVGLDGVRGSRALSAVCAGVGFQPHIQLSTWNRDVVCGLVAAEQGLGVVPATGGAVSGAVELVSLSEDGATRRTNVVYLRDRAGPVLRTALRALTGAAGHDSRNSGPTGATPDLK